MPKSFCITIILFFEIWKLQKTKITKKLPLLKKRVLDVEANYCYIYLRDFVFWLKSCKTISNVKVEMIVKVSICCHPEKNTWYHKCGKDGGFPQGRNLRANNNINGLYGRWANLWLCYKGTRTKVVHEMWSNKSHWSLIRYQTNQLM